MCCRTNDNNYPDICRTDGLCQETEQDVIWRESCTDPTWQSPQCLRLCIDGAGFGNDNIITFCSDQSICCGYQNMSCCGTKQAVWISNGQIVTTSPGPSTTSQIVSSASTPSTQSTNTITSSGSTPSSQPTNSIASSENTGLSKGAKTGISIVVSLVVIITTIGVAFVCIRRKRSRNALIAHGNGALELRGWDFEHKAELTGTVLTVNTTERGLGKPELDAVNTSVAAVLELDNNNTRQEAQELSISRSQPHTSNPALAPISEYAPITGLDPAAGIQALELDTTMPIPRANITQTSKPFIIPPPLIGSTSEVMPHPPNLGLSLANESQTEEGDLQYQERRLREKRELLAEKERLALEEDRLRERRANLNI